MNLIIMIILMFLSGILSSMSIWADKLSDVAISINDIYMTLLMCAWYLLFIGIYHSNNNITLAGIFGIIIIFYMIRKQSFIGPNQYLKSMITHHSMGVFMSKQLLKKSLNVDNIYDTECSENKIIQSILSDSIELDNEKKLSNKEKVIFRRKKYEKYLNQNQDNL